MYPIVRMLKEFAVQIGKPPLKPHEIHVSSHMCWPWDIDIFMELNNGRALTLYDLGRMPFGLRTGWLKVLKTNKWGMTMAGATVTYRARVRAFQRFTMHTTTIGRDDRFFYMQQSMWRKGKPLSSVIYRVAVTDKNGLVSSQRVADAMELSDWNPEMPKWVLDWIKAEANRPWPPEV